MSEVQVRNLKSENQTRNRFDNVEIIRGVAAVLVVLFHFSYFTSENSWYNTIFKHGYLGVDGFFIISGFVLPLSFAQKNYEISEIKQQITRRIIRIEPAYWASIFLCALKDALFQFSVDAKNFQMPDTYGFKSLTAHFFHANGFLHLPWIRQLYWTLAIDWQFYLLLCVAFFIFNQRAWWFRYPLYISIAALYWISPPDNVWASFYCFDFLAGIIFFHFTRNYIKTSELWVLWLLLLYVVYQKMGLNHFCSIGTVCCILFFVKQGTNWLRFLGKVSYSLYLTHAFSGWTLISIAQNIYPNLDDNTKTIVILSSVLVSIPFAYWFYLLVEKPTAMWAKKLVG